MDAEQVKELLDLTLIGAPKHEFPSKRPVHTFGIAAHGHFRGSEHAQSYCAAEMFSPDPTPAVVRFSNSAGQNNPEAEPQIRGMAVKFFNHAPSSFLGSGTPAADDIESFQEVDLICTGLSNFFASTPGPLVGLFNALEPRPTKQPSWLARRLADLRLNPLPRPAVQVAESTERAVLEWARNHPESHSAIAALGLHATQPPPTSFGRLSYNAVHAFNVVGRDGARHVARFHFEPVKGIRDVTPDERSEDGIDGLHDRYLTKELEQRLTADSAGSRSVRFTLRMTLADPWDDPSDSTVIWPTSRRQIIMGTLDLRGLYQEANTAATVGRDQSAEETAPDPAYGGERLSFNPGRLPLDFMSPIDDDELFKTRVAVYEESRRLRGAHIFCPIMRDAPTPES